MLALRCTQKLLKAIGGHQAIPTAQPTPALLGDWYANLLMMRRQRALLFTNELTLYSCAVFVKKTELFTITSVFAEGLIQSLTDDDVPTNIINQVLAVYRDMRLAETAHRSILGSMNNLADLLRHYVHDAGGPAACNLCWINQQLNRIPQKPLGWKFSVEALRERLLGSASLPDPSKLPPRKPPEATSTDMEGHQGMTPHQLILKLGTPEQLCVLLRDKQFGGSWSTMLEWIRTDGSAQQRAEDIPRIHRLMAYEQRYGVRLKDTLTEALRSKGL